MRGCFSSLLPLELKYLLVIKIVLRVRYVFASCSCGVWLELFYKVAEYIGYYLVCYFVLTHIFALLFGAAFAYVLFGKIVFVIHWEA